MICDGTTFTLNGSFGDAATSATWTTTGDGVIADPSDMNSLYTPGPSDAATGSITFTLTTNDPSGSCDAVSDDMVLTINPGVIVNAGSDDIICSNTSIALNGSIGGGASSATWSSPGDGSFDDDTDLNAVYTPGPIDIASSGVVLTLSTDDLSLIHI